MTMTKRRATGLLPFVPDPHNVKLAEFVVGAPKAAKACDYTVAVKTPWGMLGNDDVGDCYYAAKGHAVQGWTANVGTELTVTAPMVLADYAAGTGYNPAKTKPDGTNPTDQGTDPQTGMKQWRHDKLVGQPILAFAEVNLADLNLVRLTIEWFGGIMLGVNLPMSAQGQLEAHKAWSPGRGGAGAAGSWGGHAIWTPKYDAKGFVPITWGLPQVMTSAFLTRYGMVGYAAVSSQWMDGQGQTPSHLDKAGLLAAVAKVASH